MKHSQKSDPGHETTSQPEKLLLTVGNIVVTICEGIVTVIENGVQTYTNDKPASSNPSPPPPPPPGQ